MDRAVHGRRAKKAGAWLLAAALSTLVSLSGARSAEWGDGASGRQLAQKLCIGCHAVGKVADGAVLADVPTFWAIGNKPGQSAAAIAGRIVVPHPPMPEIQLTRREIADLAVYILSLQDR